MFYTDFMKKLTPFEKLIALLQSLSRKKPFIITAAVGMALGQLSYQAIIDRVKDQPPVYMVGVDQDQEIQDLKQQVIDAQNICLRGIKQ